MLTFCTLFDSNYLSRGVAMYESLVRHAPAAELFVIPFDERCRRTLERLRLPRMTVVPLEEFEDPELKAAKSNRPWVEYLWACTPSVLRYVIEKAGREHCTYVDADLYFFSSPQPLLEELGGDAVLVTEHRYTRRYDQTATSGRFCVQFMTFRRDADSLRALNWWREQCLVSTALDPETGKCGDQKYLDDWPERFPRVHILEHLGGGVAPWNVQQYRFSKATDGLWGEEIASGRRFPLIFYHYHGLRISEQGRVLLTGHDYELAKETVDLLYRPYLRALQAAKRCILEAGADFDPHGPISDPRSWIRARLGVFKRRVLRILRSGEFRQTNFNVPYDLEELAR